jgi:hypothetical protein
VFCEEREIFFFSKIEKSKIKLQQKETKIFGCKKEMRRI